AVRMCGHGSHSQPPAFPTRRSSDLHKRELEVVGDLCSPTAYVTVEEVLSTLNARCPQMTTSRENLEVSHGGNQGFTLPLHVIPRVHERQVSIYDALNGLRPRLLLTVCLGTRVRTLVHELPSRSPVDVSHSSPRN